MAQSDKESFEARKFSEFKVENSEGAVKGVNDGVFCHDDVGDKFYVKGAYKKPSEHKGEDNELRLKEEALESKLDKLRREKEKLESIQREKIDFESGVWDIEDTEIDIYAVSDAIDGVYEDSFETGSKSEKLYQEWLAINKKAEGIEEQMAQNEQTLRESEDRLIVLNETPDVSRTHKEIYTELLVGNLYQKLLPEQAPEIGLVVDDAHPDRVYLSSKLLDGYQSLREYSDVYGEDLEKTTINVEAAVLRELEGFEEVLAACTTLGEFDYHGDNLGVVGKKVVKIDHGMSGHFEDSREYFRENVVGPGKPLSQEDIDEHQGLGGEIALRMKVFGYQNIPCDLGKFQESLGQMRLTLREEYEASIEKTTKALGSLGVDQPDDLMKGMDERLNQVEALEKQLVLFAKMEPKISGYEFFVDKVYQAPAPIIYALKQGLTIEGKPPLLYASMVKHKITLEDVKGLTALEFAEENGVKITPEELTPKGKSGKLQEASAAVESTLKDLAPRRSGDFESAGVTGHQGANAGGDFKDKDTGHKFHLKGAAKVPTEELIDEQKLRKEVGLDTLKGYIKKLEKEGKQLETRLQEYSVSQYDLLEEIEQKTLDIEKAELKYAMLEMAPGVEAAHEDTYKEYVFGKLYNRVLPTQSPKIGLVVDDKEISIQDLREIALSDQSAELTLRSKFFDRYQSLSDYSRTKEQAELPNGRMYSKAPQLKKLEGFERVMAACLTLGEYDHHAHNLGVVERGDGRFEVVKIDHGLSGSFDYDVETAQEYGHGNSLPAASELAIYMEQYKYKNIPFDLQKFKDSLDEMVPALKAEAQTFIDRSVHELDSLGVEKPKYADYDRPQISPFNLLEAGVQFEPEQYPRGRIDFISLQNAGIEITTEQYDKALALTKSLLVKQMEKRLADVEKLSEHMELFAKMEPRIPGYKFFAGKIYAQQDPIQYAIDNGKRIDGLDPIEYRSLRDMNSSKEAALSAILRPPQKIGDVPVLDWAADNRDKIKHFDDILIFASEYRNLEIKGKEVLLWAAEEKCPIERKDAVAWAKEKALMIEGKDPILWAFEQKGQVKIEGQYPLRYAAMKGHKIKVEDGQELTAEEFAKKRGVKVEPQIAPRPEKFPISTNVAKEATLLVTNVAANIVTKEKDGPVPAPRQKNLKKAAVAAVKEVRGVKAGKPAVKAKPQDLEAGMKKVAQEVREGSKAKEVIATKSQVSKAMQERLAMFETKPTRLN